MSMEEMKPPTPEERLKGVLGAYNLLPPQLRSIVDAQVTTMAVIVAEVSRGLADEALTTARETCSTARGQARLLNSLTEALAMHDASELMGGETEFNFKTKADGLLDKFVEALEPYNHPPGPEFLEWIAGRIVEVYGESSNVDFVVALRRKAELARVALEAYEAHKAEQP